MVVPEDFLSPEWLLTLFVVRQAVEVLLRTQNLVQLGVFGYVLEKRFVDEAVHLALEVAVAAVRGS